MVNLANTNSQKVFWNWICAILQQIKPQKFPRQIFISNNCLMVTSTWWNKLTLLSRDTYNDAYLQRKIILWGWNTTKENLPLSWIFENGIISENLTKRACDLLFSNKGRKQGGNVSIKTFKGNWELHFTESNEYLNFSTYFQDHKKRTVSCLCWLYD